MATPFPSDITLGSGSTLGRYFSIVSAIPSVFLTIWLYLLWATGALTGAPHLSAIADTIKHNQPEQGLALAGAAIVIAVITHPLQFAMVQLLEGYWGGTAIGRNFQRMLITRQLRHMSAALSTDERLGEHLDAWADAGLNVQAELLEGTAASRRDILKVVTALNAAAQRIAEYPNDATHVMPTRLGNRLRVHEVKIGAAYKLPILSFATHIGMTAEPRSTEYVNDQRSQMDLAARMAVTMLVAAVATVGVMWPHGWWIMWSLVPYTLAWLSYRGAISGATAYGEAVAAWSDINRFALYKSLHLAPVADTAAERAQNSQLAHMVRGDARMLSRYAIDHGSEEGQTQ